MYRLINAFVSHSLRQTQSLKANKLVYCGLGFLQKAYQSHLLTARSNGTAKREERLLCIA